MTDTRDGLIDQVSRYYAGKIAEHGETPRGVDWNDEAGQHARFAEVCKVIEPDRDGFSLNDLGCGYGALLDYLLSRHSGVRYHGFDVSSEMLDSARTRWQSQPDATFTAASTPTRESDYGVASGIFNVRLNRADDEWRAYMLDTLDALDATSRRGFAFNCLTSYSDPDRQRDDLYYVNPGEVFDICKQRYARNVALLHDYGLYEFTVIVRKTV
ncbi:MAG: class I SAM-dependent methyltransferase [Pseudomonadota bacterium]